MQHSEDSERYRRTRSLGRGAMGEVWLAEDTLLGRTVAIKALRLDGEQVPDADQVRRIEREARVAAKVHHPNVVGVYDLLIEHGRPRLVLEYVRGESLAELIRRRGALAPAEAAAVFAQVAQGLSAAHDLGVVHRDVKPANILITDDGAVKVADFGIARGHGDATLTEVGHAVGTVAFMAPEIARGARADAASDMWSLGAALYNALEGRAPHGSTAEQSAATLLLRLVSEPVPEPVRAGSLRGILDELLDPDPARRPCANAVARRLASPRPAAVPRADLAAAAPQSCKPGEEEPTTIRPVAAPAPEAPAAAARASGNHAVAIWSAAAVLIVGIVAAAVTLIAVSGKGGSTRADAPPTTAASPAADPVTRAAPDDPSASDGAQPVIPDFPTTGASTDQPTGGAGSESQTAMQSYSVENQISAEPGDCDADSHGRIHDYITSASTCELSRSLYSAVVDGRDVAVSVATVAMDDSSMAQQLADLDTQNGTGDVRTLPDSGETYPGGPTTWADDPTFYARVDDSGNTEILEAMWNDGTATHENSPALRALLTAVAADVQ